MALDASLGSNRTRVLYHQASAFIAKRNPSTGVVTDWVPLGLVRNVKIGSVPKRSSKDSTGSEPVRGHDYTASFTLMQTSRHELSSLSAIQSEGPVGSMIKFTRRASKTAAGAGGFVIEDVEFAPTTNVNLDSETESDVAFEGKWSGGRTTVDQLGTVLSAADANRLLIAGDVLIGPYVDPEDDGF